MPTAHPSPNIQDKPWYIHDQGWSALVAADPSMRYACLNPQLLRPMRKQSTFEKAFPAMHERDNPPHAPRPTHSEAELEQYWIELDDKESVLTDAITLSGHGPLSTRRLCIVSDAGMGKTKLVGWLHYRIHQTDTRHEPARVGALALELNLTELEKCWEANKGKVQSQPFYEMLLEFLADRFVTDRRRSFTYADINLARQAMLRVLKTCAGSGNLTLLADGLDQIENKNELLQEFLNTSDPRTQQIRLMVAGRSNAVLAHWKEVFCNPAWTFVRVEPFRRDQQVRYLGWLPTADRSSHRGLRYSKIPHSARDILVIPRVLEYLLEVQEFDALRTPADVYARAIDRMIEKGNALLPAVQRGKATPRLVRELLARQAFHSFYRSVDSDAVTFRPNVQNGVRVDPGTWTRLPSPPETAPPEKYLYNIEGFKSESEFEGFKGAIYNESSRGLQEAFEQAWDAVQKLNQFLDYGIFDASELSDPPGRLVWANRSLHEFLLAYYFANHATLEESNALWDRIYLPDKVATDDFYPFWQFLCDMPDDHCVSEAWLRSVELLYWPNIRKSDAKSLKMEVDNSQYPFYAKRSNEMIYRSWSKLEGYCNSATPAIGKLANGIRNRWWGEFESGFLAGAFGPELESMAKSVTTHLIPMPGGSVKMGTTPERQSIPGLLEYLRMFLADFRDEAKLANYFESKPYFKTRAGKVEREHREKYWRSLAKLGSLSEAQLREAALVSFSIGFFSNPEFEIGPFGLGRQTISNAWYRMYDSRHGHQWSDYGLVSETSQHPAVSISFFDAWVYCQWLRWEGLSCRLPYETEWEYAAKFGFASWESDYWWDDATDPDCQASRSQFDATKINCHETTDKTNTEHGCTRIPSADRASPPSRELDRSAGGKGLGLMDMQGNTWEWCQDRFRADHAVSQIAMKQRREQDTVPDAVVFRVLRGGSFFSLGRNATVSSRDRDVPSDTNHSVGCRVARASLRKP